VVSEPVLPSNLAFHATTTRSHTSVSNLLMAAPLPFYTSSSIRPVAYAAVHSPRHTLLCCAPLPCHRTDPGGVTLGSYWALGSKRWNFLCATEAGLMKASTTSLPTLRLGKSRVQESRLLPYPAPHPSLLNLYLSLGGWADPACTQGTSFSLPLPHPPFLLTCN
jgi:hypothetical protein